MTNITEIKTLEDLQKLYDANSFVYENCDDRPFEYLMEHYGEPDAAGFVFTGKLVYEACGLPTTSSLPEDRTYLVVVPNKKIYEGSTLIPLKSLIWRYATYTGHNALAQRKQVKEKL